MWIGRFEAKSTTSPKLVQWWITRNFVMFIMLIVTALTPTADATQTIRFEMEEERPNGYLVGLLIKHLPDAILTGPGQLTFRTIQDGHAHLFTLGPTDGRIQVAHRIDREELCPDSNEPRDTLQIKPECLLTFSVNLLRLNTVGTDIVDILRIIILLHDIDDNVCFFTPSHQQLIKIPENMPPNMLSNIPLHAPCDLDTGPGNGIEQSFIRLIFPTTFTSTTSAFSSPNSFASMSSLSGALSEKPPFVLNMNRTGLITKPFALFLVPQQMFDYEQTSHYELLVEASGANRSEQRSCRLKITVQIVDQNDFAPRFIQNHSVIKIPETASLNVPIYTLSAVDSDLGPLYSQLIYEFDVHATPAVKARFRIDHRNGSIFLLAPLDYRKQAFYDIPLVVRNPLPQENTESPSRLSEILQTANEARFMDRALLQVQVLDVNDQPPMISVFTPDGGDSISLREHTKDIPLDIAVVTVVDEDTDTGNAINCSLDDSVLGQFRLTPISPVGKQQSFHNKKRDDTPLEVIYKLSALASFDREVTSYVDVKIRCQDEGSPPLRAEHIVHVRVDDINDHPPVLNQTKLRLTVTEDSDPSRKHIGYAVGRIVATDPDIGVNSRLTYELVSRDDNADYFVVDNETGMIRSRGNLDRERQNHFQLEIKVTDGGTPKLTTFGIVDVQILDYNDEAPIFEKQAYEFRITENNGLGELVGNLRASDKDEGTNAIIHFHMEPLTKIGDRYRHTSLTSSAYFEEAAKLPFDLVSYYDTVHGTYEIRIYARQALDRETVNPSDDETSDPLLMRYDHKVGMSNTNVNNGLKANPSYKFWVVGEDAGTPKRRGQSLVQVFIDDMNDELPRFLSPDTNDSLISISYLEKTGHMIRQLLATDRDAGPNGTVRYRLEQIRFHNCTKPPSRINTTQSQPTSTNAHFALTELFTVHPVTGILRLGETLTAADIGSLFAVTVIAQDMGVPHSLRTTATVYIQVDDSVPVGDPMDDAGGYLADSHSQYGYGKPPEDGSALNFYIIISIVSISFMISAILISAICIALRKRKQTPIRSVSRSSDSNGGVNIPMSDYYAAEKLNTGISPDGSRSGSLCGSSTNQSAVSPKHVQTMATVAEMKQPPSSEDGTVTPVLDPILSYGPPLMQVVNLQPCNPAVSTVSDMKALRLMCSEHGTVSRLLGGQYDTGQTKPTSSEATIILCASDYAPNMYPVSMQNPMHMEHGKMATDDLHTAIQQPVTLINYTHPMEVQHLCVHPPQATPLGLQITTGKRNSLGSTDQDSGNGDSLNTTSAPIVAGTKPPSIWLPTPLALSRTDSPPVQSLTLPLVHVYTPLSCVAENETNGTNPNGMPH